MMPSMQMLMFLRSPCGRIYFFGTAATGLLARPFADPFPGFVKKRPFFVLIWGNVLTD
jgi:hypothetical protein